MAERLFGTDGVRGVAGQFPIDVAGAYRLGRAVAATMARGGLVEVGRDPRPSGEELAAALVDGLLDGGCDTVDLGVVPTPAVAHFVDAEQAVAGVAISASHNPAGENGFKLFGPGGAKVDEDVEQTVELAFQANGFISPAARGRQRRATDAVERYVDFALGTLPPGLDLRGLTIAVDGARGATSVSTPLALTKLGATVITTCCDGDGARINEDCGSLHPETVRALAEARGATLGLAHDGDGDRLVLIDENRDVVCGDRILGLSAEALQERGELTGGHVVGTVMTNFGLEQWLKAHGMRLHRSAVGDRNVWNLMGEVGADLGGEPSGHTIFRRLCRTDDALLTALQVLGLMAASGRELRQLGADIELVPQALVNLRVTRKPDLESVPEIAAALVEAERRLAERGRMVVRYSGTENKARILAEGSDPGLLSEVVGHIAEAFRSAGIAA